MNECEESFCRNVLKTSQVLSYICGMVLSKYLKSLLIFFIKPKPVCIFNVNVMIFLASFDACLLGIQKGQDINYKEKV